MGLADRVGFILSVGAGDGTCFRLFEFHQASNAEEEDDGFDFDEALREIHVELEGLNAEAAELATRISRNFKELGI